MIVKRYKIVFISFIVVLSSLFFFKDTSALVSQDQFTKSFIGNYHYVVSNGHYGDFEYFQRASDKQIAYCIQPGVSLSYDVYQGFSDLSLQELANAVSLTSEQLNQISLIAFFGWGYNGQYGYDWIVATQSLIWKTLGLDFQFTSRNSKASPWQYVIDTPYEIQEKMNSIESMVNSYLAKPILGHAKIGINTTYVFNSNVSLNGYSISNCQNCNAHINEKQLIVTPNSKEAGSVDLKKEIPFWGSSFVVYERGDGQNLIVPGNINPIETMASFEIISGSLKLKKYDADNKSCTPKQGGSLAGSIYKLYKTDNTYVKDLVIDENCSANVSDLELGSYYIQESKAGENYEIDTTKYYFDLTVNNFTKELVVYDKMYLGQVQINKIDSKTYSCQSSSPYASLQGAKYGIYKIDGTFIDALVISKNCSSVSKRNLLLGDYYIQEISAPKGYKLDSNKYYFSVAPENADGTILIDVMDDIYETKLTINKSYLFYGTTKPEVGAVFGIYYKSTNKKIATLIMDENGIASTTLPYGEYIIKQEKGVEGYHFVDDILFIVDENIKKTSYLNLLNKPYIGSLEFNKIDSLTYQGLAGATICVYNELDELIYTGITDQSGKIIFNNLSYGKYYIVEKEAPKGYYLSDEKIYFEIKEDGQVVFATLTNNPIIEVPDTLSNDLNIKYCFIIIFLILFVGLMFYEKEKN